MPGAITNGTAKLRCLICIPETNDTDISLVELLTFQVEVPDNLIDAPNITVIFPVALMVYVNVSVKP